MKNSVLPALVLSLMITACGGDGNDSTQPLTTGADQASADQSVIASSGTNGDVTGSPIQVVKCPDSAVSFTSTDSTIANANISFGSASSASLKFKSPASGKLTLDTCLVEPSDSAYTPPPAPVVALLGTNKIAAHLIANGEFNVLRNIQLTLLKKTDSELSAGQANAFKIVAYTQNAAGAWERTALQTVPGQLVIETVPIGTSLAYTAIISKPGYYSIENL